MPQPCQRRRGRPRVRLAGPGRAALAVLAVGALLLAACTRQVAGQGRAGALAGTGAATAVPTGTDLPTPGGTPPVTTPGRPTTARPTGTPGPPCPAEAAVGVPGGRRATYIVGYQTASFRIYFCRGTDQRVYYRGVSRADPGNALTLPATAVPGGFEARTVGDDGRDYAYLVAAGRLVVTRDGAVLRDEPVLGQI